MPGITHNEPFGNCPIYPEFVNFSTDLKRK